jgi:ABC-type amino acid transport system permease subunit
MEAGRTLGLPYGITMRKIILPQAFKNILPALFNELIALLKETSVAAFIAVSDLTRSGDLIRAKTYDPFLPLLAVASIYLILVIGLTQLVGRLERRLRRSDNR